MKELEETLNISKMTVLSTLEFANTLLPATLSIVIIDKGVQLRNESEQSIDMALIDIAKQTISYQVLKHVFYDENLHIRKLADKLFISESALRVRIAHMNKVLRAFGCSISFYDVKINGDETNIRYFYYAFFSEFQELFIASCEDQLIDCSDVYSKMKRVLEKYDHGLLNYSYQQAARWLFIITERMKLNKCVWITASLSKRMGNRISYRDFEAIYQYEMSRHLNQPRVPEAEVIWAYIVGFSTIIYTNTRKQNALSRYEEDNRTDMEMIAVALMKVMDELGVHPHVREGFEATHMAYFLNLRLLTEVSPIFQMGSNAVKSYAVKHLNPLYSTWLDPLAELDDAKWINISHMRSMAAQLAMISSQFVFRQGRHAEKIIFSFDGEAGLPVCLESMARMLLPKGVEGIFIYDEPITTKLIKRISPDIVVTNYQTHEAIAGCRTLKMSCIPQVREWTLLRELIINIDYNHIFPQEDLF